MFQIKDFASIAASMINHAKATQDKITDFRVGSVVRTLMESAAIEIEELYIQILNGIRESIPVAIYKSFNFDSIQERIATGVIRVTITLSVGDVLVSSGTKFIASDGAATKYESVDDVTIPQGSTYADIKVYASLPGTSGNLQIGTLFDVTPQVAGIVSAVSIAGFSDGADTESESETKARFINYISSLNRGTVSALRYGIGLAKVVDSSGFTIESVKSSVIVEPWSDDVTKPVGLVECFIHNGVDGASSDLVLNVSKVIDGYVDVDGTIVPGWKAAGVRVNVLVAPPVTVSVSGTVTVSAGYGAQDVVSSVSSAISEYISSLDIGDDVFLSEIVFSAMSIDGVVNFRLTVPTVDIVVGNTQKAMVGTLNIISD